MKSVTYVLINLVSDILVEALLFLTDHFIFSLVDGFIPLNALEVLSHDLFVHVLLLRDLFLVPLQGLFPSVALRRVAVLDDAVVLVGAHVATVM